MIDIQIQTLKETDLTRFCALTGSYPLQPEQILLHSPDRLVSINDSGKLLARASLWWRETATYREKRLGYIGHFAVKHDHGAAAIALLRACEEQLSSQKCGMAVGPIDGSTWRHYRLLTERGGDPAFFLEPDNPDAWPHYFESSGFTPIAHYYSSINDDIHRFEYPTVRETELTQQGITLQPIDTHNLDQEMRTIYTMSCEAFASNFLYTPISESEFLYNYQQLLSLLDYNLIHIARHHNHPIGFCFCLPDIKQRERGKQLDTMIIKTIAVIPDYQGMGVGSLLIGKSLDTAKRWGLSRAIHAMMHEDNRSRLINRTQMRDFRQYTLYGKVL